jgi:hypothetical protein
MRLPWLAIVLLSAVVLLSTACMGGGSGPQQCEIAVLGIDRWELTNQGPDVAYHVRGRAGSAGVVWLAARRGEGDYVSGYGIDVGPGPFEAIVDLKLTALPRAFEVVLEVAGRRCRADAPAP